MSEVTRDEFDRLVERVTRVEHTLGATVEIVASEVVGLRTYLDERFDHQDRMLDALGAEVQVEFDAHTRVLERIVGQLERQAGAQTEQGGKLDAQAGVLAEQAGVLAEQGRKLDSLLDRFGIDPTA
jgi:uncharacterized coiled-coil protein SlyX